MKCFILMYHYLMQNITIIINKILNYVITIESIMCTLKLKNKIYLFFNCLCFKYLFNNKILYNY